MSQSKHSNSFRACYQHPECKTFTEARQKVWAGKVAKSIVGPPKLQTLPPTTEAMQENVASAHLHVAIWRHANESQLPVLDPVKHGWQRDGKSLVL